MLDFFAVRYRLKCGGVVYAPRCVLTKNEFLEVSIKEHERMNINFALDKAYEEKPLKEVVDAPVAALQGVSEGDAEYLQKAFNIKTVGDLANCKYFLWAQAITTLAKTEE